MRTNKSAERQGGWDCPKDNRSGGRAPVETGLRHSGGQQRTPQGDMPRRAAAVAAASQAGRYTLMRPLAILMALLLFLTLPLVCSGGGSDNSNSNDDDNSNGNGDDNRNNNDNDNDNDNGNLPGAPTSLSATANGSSQIDLSWEAPADNGGSAVTGYRISYRQGSGAGAAEWMDAAADTEDAESSYSHISLTAETTYSYRVYAINENGSGPASEETMATTDMATPIEDTVPGAPVNLTASANGSSAIDLTWDAPANDGGSAITGYRMEYKEGSGDWMDAAADTGTTAIIYSHTGLTAATDYSYRVSAINANGTGPASDVAMATTYTALPGVPTGLTATPADGEVTLSWTDPEHCGNGNLCNATTHQHWLEYKLSSTADDNWANGAVVASSPHATMHAVTGLVNGMQYDFRLAVQLTGANDRGPWLTGVAYAGPNSDGDEVIDNLDVDDDNDGLIEIRTRTELENMAHNLAGSSYKDADGASGDTTGAPTTEPTNCNDGDTNTTVVLCGYELANDINLGGTTSATTDDPPDISCATNAWTPIGGCGSDGTCGEVDDPITAEIETNDDEPFTAILDGNGFTISNLCVEAVVESTDRHDLLGLFGYLDDATVRNLAIAEIYIESKFVRTHDGAEENSNRLGALVGCVMGDTVIFNVAVADSDSDIDLQGAETSDTQHIGGLVGYQAGGSITASYATGDAVGGDGHQDRVGGLVGWQSGGNIVASYATGDADGGDGWYDTVGGLLGLQSGGSIAASYATGDVDGGNGDSDFVGGLVGQKSGGSIAASYATGDATGGDGNSDYGGVLLGHLTGSLLTIIASYGFGDVSGEEATGLYEATWPRGVMSSVAELTSGAYDDSDPASTSAGDEWSTTVWDFGDSSQAPALKYVDGYTFDKGADDMIGTDDDTHSYSCDDASFGGLSVTCGTTLLPGQR